MEDMKEPTTCEACGAEVAPEDMDAHNKESHPDKEEKGDDMPAGDDEDKM